jgi:hypothetical protein
MQEWMRWEPTRDRRRFGSLLLTPARVAVGAGAAMAAIAGLMPWAEGTVPGRGGFEHAFFSGLGGAGDGLALLLLAGGIAFLVLHRTPATSRVRLVHVVPWVLWLFAAATVLNGWRAALLEIGAWERRGGSGSLAPGMYLAVGGVVVMLAGMVALLPAIVRWTRNPDGPADLMTISARGVAEVVGAVVGVFVGGAVGIQLAVALTPIPVIGLIAIGSITGGLLGAYAGAWAGRSAVDAITARRGPRTGAG